MSETIEIDEQHTNSNGRFCCPHCLQDNDIDEWFFMEMDDAKRHTCTECGQDFAVMCRSEVVQVSGFIAEDEGQIDE